MHLRNNKEVTQYYFEVEKQLTFLKEHEADMTQFIKAQNSKIESVQFDWDSVRSVRNIAK